MYYIRDESTGCTCNVIMNRRAIVRLVLMLVWVTMMTGQELGVEVGKVENVAVGEVEQEDSKAVVAEEQGSQLQQDLEEKKAEDTSGIGAAPT